MLSFPDISGTNSVPIFPWKWTLSCFRNVWNLHILIRLSYLLTLWSRVLLEKRTGLQLVKKCPPFYGTRRFITAFTCPFPQPAQSSPYPPHPTSWRSILILSSHLHLVLSSVSPRKFHRSCKCFKSLRMIRFPIQVKLTSYLLLLWLLLFCVQTGPGAHPASYTMGTGSFPGVKQPGRGVDNPLPPGAEVKEKV
jgi:hypothetical protein